MSSSASGVVRKIRSSQTTGVEPARFGRSSFPGEILGLAELDRDALFAADAISLCSPPGRPVVRPGDGIRNGSQHDNEAYTATNRNHSRHLVEGTHQQMRLRSSPECGELSTCRQAVGVNVVRSGRDRT